jgi:glycosyltransferase 2 family protein
LKHLTTLLITLAKIVLSLGILGYLFYSALSTPEGSEAFVKMLEKGKAGDLAWGLLIGGFATLLAAITITIVRWSYLVRALGIDFSLPDAMRIGFIGYLFNLAPMGIVGGDLLKAWMLAREKPGNRAKALASVVVDRIVGLYVLFLVAAAGVFITGFWQIPDIVVHRICWAVLIVTFVSTVGIVLILVPGFLEGRLMRSLTRIPKVGPAIDSLLQAILIYRSKRFVLFVTALMTIPVHSLLATSIFLLGLGLGFDRVSGWDYLAIYPISGILSTIPLPAGPAETGIVFFYKTALLRATQGAVNTAFARTEGTILALVYRLTVILVAPIGAAYYFLGGRSEVTEVMHEAELEGRDGEK